MFAATQQIASVAGLKATKVQVRISFRIARFEGWFRKEEDERFFVTTRESNQKKKSRSDEDSFLLFFFFFFFFFSRGEKAKACRSLDERGCFFARFFPLRVDHSLLDEDPPRAREKERERESRSRWGWRWWFSLCFLHWLLSFFVGKSEILFIFDFLRYFRGKKADSSLLFSLLQTKSKYIFVPCCLG